MHMFCIVFFFQLLTLGGATESGIVGGKVSKPHSRPYMASLQFHGHHSCGGILVRKDFVLTAAHCKYSQDMTVVLGAHNISKAEKSQQSIEVAKYYQHPKFTGLYDYDIMLLKLKTNAKLNHFVDTIELPKMEDGKVTANSKCVVAGWGNFGEKKPFSDVMRETTEKIQFSFECKNIWRQYFRSENMVCTKFNKKTGGFCQGDSGGPLICDNKPEGIIAFTEGGECNNHKYPHVFTQVHYFLPWIKTIMQKYENVTSATT